MAIPSDITPELCRQLLRYEPETGRLYWRERDVSLFTTTRAGNSWNSRLAGRVAFTADDGRGYRVGGIHHRTLLAHRVIWAVVYGEWPTHEIDHINGIRDDNRLANLRAVTRVQNGRNIRRSSRNRSGRIGVCWSKRMGKWQAYIKNREEYRHLGYFTSFGDACHARAKAEANLGYHANHGR